MIKGPGFSRIRLFRQYAVTPAGRQPAEAGIPGWHTQAIFSLFTCASAPHPTTPAWSATGNCLNPHLPWRVFR